MENQAESQPGGRARVRLGEGRWTFTEILFIHSAGRLTRRERSNHGKKEHDEMASDGRTSPRGRPTGRDRMGHEHVYRREHLHHD